MCGLIFKKLIMTVMKSQLVVDHCDREKELELKTLAKYGHDIHQLLTSIQEKKNEIDTLCKDGVNFNKHRLPALVFNCLLLAKWKCFGADVNCEKSAWVKDPAAIDNNNLIIHTTNVYTNYKSTSEWGKKAVFKDAVIVSLLTDLDAEHANKKSAAACPGVNCSRK